MRIDKRLENQLRDMSVSVGFIQSADGSCKFSFGKTCCVCTVSGPTQAKQWQEKIDRATIQVSWNSENGSSGITERYYEQIVAESAEALIQLMLFPRSLININVQVYYNDGGLLATAINAMVLALVDAGIPLVSLCTTVSCCLSKGNQTLLDPNQVELEVFLSNQD